MAKTILITGCSSGIGRSAARHFAAKGWNVIATMRTPDQALAAEWPDRILVAPDDYLQRVAAHGAGEPFELVHVVGLGGGWGRRWLCGLSRRLVLGAAEVLPRA